MNFINEHQVCIDMWHNGACSDTIVVYSYIPNDGQNMS
jgi:hypothetical protein